MQKIERESIMLALEKQYNFYLENESELLGKYENKYLVIAEDLSIYPFDNKKDAYYYGASRFGLGHFLLQHCNYDDAHTVHTVNFRVIA